MISFVNTGMDLRILKSIPETLKKSYPGTIPVQVLAHPKDGRKPYLMTVNKAPVKFPNVNKTTLPESPLINSGFHYFHPKTRKVLNLDQLIHVYNSMPQDKRNGFENFIKSNFFASNGKVPTTAAYRVSWGKYQPKRFNEVHKPIIESKLAEADTPPPGQKPICFLYGGGSASGKSTVVSAVVKPFMDSTGLKFANMDCDELKPLLPEFPMFLQENPKSAYSRVHRESSDLCGECLDVLMKQSKCFMFSGIMGDAQRTKGMIDKLNKLGYEVHLVCIDVPIDLAISRASKRDRFMSDSIITTSHRKFASAFNQLFNYPGVSSCELYDNSQPPNQPPTLIMDKSGVHNQALYTRFKQKSQKAYDNYY